MAQVRHNCGVRIRGVDIEDVTRRDRFPAELPCVTVILDFEHAAAEIGAIPIQELVDVVAIQRPSTVESPDIAERTASTEIPPIHWGDMFGLERGTPGM